jgi:hypothetical protein
MAIQEWPTYGEEIDFLNREWYAKPNDLIGGWCVMPVDATPAECNIPEVADFTTEKLARHIAKIHNEWLLIIDMKKAGIKYPYG